MSKFSQASSRFNKTGETNLHNNGKPDPKSKNEKDDFKYESDAGGYELILSPTKPGGNIVKTGKTFGGDKIKVGRDAEGQGVGRDTNYYRGIVTENLKGQYNRVEGVKSRGETPQEKADRIKQQKRLSAKG